MRATTWGMMRFVKPAENATRLYAPPLGDAPPVARWMRPRKSEGSQTVTSEPCAEWTSSRKRVVRAGVSLRHCMAEKETEEEARLALGS